MDRRRLLTMTGLAGAGVATALVVGGGEAANAATSGGVSDASVLNFALNLEYLEAEFYQRAVFGHGLSDEPDHRHRPPRVRARRAPGALHVQADQAVRRRDRQVTSRRTSRSSDPRSAAPRSPARTSPSTPRSRSLRRLPASASNFDPYANETNFLLGAFVFEDVGVTAYKGAAPLISNKTYLEAAAGILSVEAYHAATIRSTLFEMGHDAISAANAISDARDSLDGRRDDDQHITGPHGVANIVPADHNGITYSRSPGQVLNVVYLNPNAATKGGFFPTGVNGAVNTSAGAAS